MEEKTSCKNILFLKKYEKLVIQFSGSFTGTEREEQMILEQDKIVYCTVGAFFSVNIFYAEVRHGRISSLESQI